MNDQSEAYSYSVTATADASSFVGYAPSGVSRTRRRSDRRLGYLFVKRAFDILASGLFLLVFGWFLLLLMFIKFCEDGHNPIYTSIRVGYKGKKIKFHKIRSMKPHAEAMKDELIAAGLNEADGPVFKMKDDPRITRFGKFLRKTSLDELPQIWDIFVGRISIVGPRSPLPQEVAEYSRHEMRRLDVKGGLVCLWQITPHRHDLSFEEWVDLDLEYIRSRSVLMDLKILFKAVKFVLTDRTGE
ncbi:MAG: sugar transferase [Bacilli bacterium]|nr:sugar transferase [Bacilli bacterium]